MGVVYKLKDEVIEFIVQLKKQKPDLSCRKLANITNEKFDLDISKSSVNTILKNSQLSSPVGRRPGESIQPKTYKMPEKAKKTLFQGLKKKAPVSKPKKQPVADTQSARGTTKVKAASQSAQPKKKELSKLKEPPRTRRLKPKVVVSEDKGMLYDGMGAIFLKAAQWDLSSSPILGGILKDHVKGFSFEDISAAAEVLMYLEPFGIKQVEDIAQYTSQGLWVINGLSPKVDYHVILQAIGDVKDVMGFALKLSNEIPQILSEISYLKITLQDTEEYCMDAQFSTLWDSNVQSGVAAPHNKLLSNLSRNIINNLQPLVLCSVPGQTCFSKEFYELLASFENLPGRGINKITLYDYNNEEVAQFSTIPSKARHFIVGAWPWQKEFEVLSQGQSLKKQALRPLSLSQDVFYSEIDQEVVQSLTQGLCPALRGFLVQETPEGEPIVAVLTNLPASEASTGDVVLQYINRWPNLHRGHNIFLAKSSDIVQASTPYIGYSLSHEVSDIYSHIRTMLAALNDYCQRYFFPAQYEGMDINSLISIFYSLPGFLVEGQDTVCVTLTRPQSGYGYKEDLNHAINRVNESNVKDYMGRRLIIRAV